MWGGGGGGWRKIQKDGVTMQIMTACKEIRVLENNFRWSIHRGLFFFFSIQFIE